MRVSRRAGLLLALGALYAGYAAWNVADALQKRSVYDVCPYQLALFRTVPLGLMTRAAGAFAALHVPLAARRPLYGAFAAVYGCDLSECDSVDTYPTFNAFFTRALRPGSRRIDAAAPLVSPVDGRMYACGRLDESGGVFPAAVKGLRYPLARLLGLAPGEAPPAAQSGNALFYAAIYLSPGAYHRFHAPADSWAVERIRRIPGEVLPVAPWIMRRLPLLPMLNERAVLDGAWAHGRMAMVPVGATNVRSIRLSAEVAPGAVLGRGAEVGRFDMGSLVVLVFEAPSAFAFVPTEGSDVRLGEALGRL